VLQGADDADSKNHFVNLGVSSKKINDRIFSYSSLSVVLENYKIALSLPTLHEGS
jgi:hypothetical protein